MSVILMFQFYVQGHSCFYAVFVLIFIEDQDYVAQFSIKFKSQLNLLSAV